jgi:hypothetical protein
MASVTLVGQSLTISRGALFGYVHWKATVVLPSLFASGSMHVNPTMAGASQLPRITAKGYGGATAKISLPAIGFAGGMTIPNLGRVTATLPTVTGSGTGLTGMIASIAMTLPKLSGVSYAGAKAVIVLPKLVPNAHAFVAEHGAVAILLPKLRMSGVGHRSVDSAYANILLPKLYSGQQVRNNVIMLPRLAVNAHFTNVAVATMQAWSLNLKNNAMTQFLNFPFRAFVRWQNKYYGIGISGGLYLLEGDTDVGAPIGWEFETGHDDLGSNAQKGVSGVYIEGIIAAGATLTLIDDHHNRYEYNTHSTSPVTDQRTYRVVTGKGLRSRNYAINMKNALGGYMEVNQIAPKFVISKRNV